MKRIYILLTRTGTLTSKAIHTMTNEEFTHASIALVPQTDQFYSYGRRKLYNPFNSGFIIENIHTNVFGKYPNCHCALYSIDISNKAYDNIKKYIKHLMRNYKKATYNFAGLFSLALGIGLKHDFKFTCSQFVAITLKNYGEIELPKDPFLMHPSDFLSIKNINKIYEGTLRNCNFGSNTISSKKKLYAIQ